MHQHFLEEESARSNTLERELVLEEEEAAKAGSSTLEREILLEEGADQHILELDEANKTLNRDEGEGKSGLAEGEEECLNFYPRSKLFSSLLSR